MVKKGETLSKIARLYRIDLEPILEINRLNKKSRLSVGMNLLIPLPKGQPIKPPSMAMETSDRMDQYSKPIETTYPIKKGDS
jgi:LysM repeat protein